MGMQISNSWLDPPIVLMASIPVALFGAGYSACAAHNFVSEANWPALVHAVAPWAMAVFAWRYLYHGTSKDAGVNTHEFVTWRDADLADYYHRRRIPMAELYELYVSQKFDWNPDCEGGDCYLILKKHRHKFVNYKTTAKQMWWLLSQFLPVAITGSGLGFGSSSGKSVRETTKEIDEHYNKGNAVFEAMLGKSMTYTCALFDKPPGFASDMYAGDYHKSAQDGALERAQHRKLEAICDRLRVEPGQTFLDIGCGWGTLSRHAAANRGTLSSAVTLSVEGRRFCNESSDELQVPVCTHLCDYRDIPNTQKYDSIASIEMAEHVGIGNFASMYLRQVRQMMKSDSSRFLMQVSGIRQGADWQDIAWGLFMSKYIFPGADASTPLHWYVKMCECAGFEVESVDTIGRPHYSWTLHKWYDNWMSKREDILAGDIDAISPHSRGVHMFRLQEFFLAWSVIASAEGSASCYQITMRKNTRDYPDQEVSCYEKRKWTDSARDAQMKRVCHWTPAENFAL